MRTQLALRRVWHDQDILIGKVDVWLPDALNKVKRINRERCSS
jgi:hypothetical protein